MSMLSAQCDELRVMAESVGLEMPQAATLMMEAADTIWELRDSLDLALDSKRIAEHRVTELLAENAKLRELCETFGMIANDAICDYYDRDELLAQANVDARELGVEL